MITLYFIIDFMQRLQGFWNESGKGLFLLQWSMSAWMENGERIFFFFLHPFNHPLSNFWMWKMSMSDNDLQDPQLNQ